MKVFPHRYTARATARPEGDVRIRGDGLPLLETAPPAEFDGPGDRWSPETLLVGAVADCFALSFRAIARAAKLDWSSLECSAEGVLDRCERTTQFTDIVVRAKVRLPAGADPALARRLLERAEQTCLISNSLRAERHLVAEVETAPHSAVSEAAVGAP